MLDTFIISNYQDFQSQLLLFFKVIPAQIMCCIGNLLGPMVIQVGLELAEEACLFQGMGHRWDRLEQTYGHW